LILCFFILVFPSEPRIIEDFKFFDNSSDVKISWLEPVVRGKGKLSYIVEILKGGKWKHEIFTSDLHTTLTSPSLSDHIRVCARNDVEPKKVSCSKSYGKCRKYSSLSFSKLPNGSDVQYQPRYLSPAKLQFHVLDQVLFSISTITLWTNPTLILLTKVLISTSLDKIFITA
jgi:hypothetical protein